MRDTLPQSDMDSEPWDLSCPTCHEIVCDCASDYDAPIYCAHDKNIDTYCPDCAVAAETALAVAFAKALERIDRERDEEMGTALAARFGGER